MIKREHYVYVIFDAQGIPCYVGKGKKARWTNHESPSGWDRIRDDPELLEKRLATIRAGWVKRKQSTPLILG
jgi:hypothetical protein